MCRLFVSVPNTVSAALDLLLDDEDITWCSIEELQNQRL